MSVDSKVNTAHILVILIMGIDFVSGHQIQFTGGEIGAPCKFLTNRTWGVCTLIGECPGCIDDYNKGIEVTLCSLRHTEVACCYFEEFAPCYEKPSILKDAPHQNSRRLGALWCNFYYDDNVRVPIVSRPYPHMVALGWHDIETNSTAWYCGGTIISEFYILTAGHCVLSGRGPPNVVSLGASDLIKEFHLRQTYKIASIIAYPEYKFGSYYNDIALIRLSQNIREKGHVEPACLWQYDNFNFHKPSTVGYGLHEFNESSNLQLLAIDLKPSSVCQTLFPSDAKTDSTLVNGVREETQICAGDPDGISHICQGVNGGPLQVEEKMGFSNRFHILGITSFGSECGGKVTAIYTRVSAYLDWIEDIVWSSGPPRKSELITHSGRNIKFNEEREDANLECGYGANQSRFFSDLYSFLSRKEALIESSDRKSALWCKIYSNVSGTLNPNIYLGNGCTHTRTEDGEMSHQAAIGIRDGFGVLWKCGGALISDKFVITAGHCTNLNGVEPNTVSIGKLSIKYTKPKETFGIDEIFVHPRYEGTYYDDIGLMKLSRSVQISYKLRPACIWEELWPECYNKTSVVSGYGIGGASDLKLRKVGVDFIEEELCDSTYDDHLSLPTGIAVDTQICAGPSSRTLDPCDGDVGAPLQIIEYDERDEEPDRYILFGIKLFGNQCKSKVPGLYLKLAPYLDWIESIVWP